MVPVAQSLDSVAIPQFGSVVILQFDPVAILQFDSLAILQFGSVVILKSDSVAIPQFDPVAIPDWFDSAVIQAACLFDWVGVRTALVENLDSAASAWPCSPPVAADGLAD